MTKLFSGPKYQNVYQYYFFHFRKPFKLCDKTDSLNPVIFVAFINLLLLEHLQRDFCLAKIDIKECKRNSFIWTNTKLEEFLLYFSEPYGHEMLHLVESKHNRKSRCAIPVDVLRALLNKIIGVLHILVKVKLD